MPDFDWRDLCSRVDLFRPWRRSRKKKKKKRDNYPGQVLKQKPRMQCDHDNPGEPPAPCVFPIFRPGKFPFDPSDRSAFGIILVGNEVSPSLAAGTNLTSQRRISTSGLIIDGSQCI
ncbi:hypothetical protein TWF730_000049 [Orbilia blumenaviensis]|uniref:Uncharacterized protein n=1 Tax=Orbilia blumenaviensis TaxID=1796055 RepID=A0AAV9VKQ3_9PEZI